MSVDRYLRNEHKKGRLNIFTAILSVAARFGLSYKAAKKVVLDWVEENVEDPDSPNSRKNFNNTGD